MSSSICLNKPRPSPLIKLGFGGQSGLMSPLLMIGGFMQLFGASVYRGIDRQSSRWHNVGSNDTDDEKKCKCKAKQIIRLTRTVFI